MDVLISQDCTSEERDYITQKLVEYNLRNVPSSQNPLFESLNLILRDKENQLIGGILGELACWNRLNIDIFWIDEHFRNLGFGKKLLSEAEIAKQRRCKIILVDTFSFQAPDFYLKNGYELYATLDNCPEGHKKYYFKKVIE